MYFGERNYSPEDADGYDFEAFVFECFDNGTLDSGLVRRLAKSRDGAIDIVKGAGGETTIIECKYIGDSEYKTAVQRWRNVKGKLEKYLPKLAKEKDKRQGSPYRFWLDTTSPVTRYELCISAPLSNLEARELCSEIQSFFDELSKNEGLEVLSTLGTDPDAVGVQSWDKFASILEARPALAFRWFGGLPNGVESFSLGLASHTGFNRFLDQRSLPYFSRSEFIKGEAGRANLQTEGIFLGHLQSDAQIRGLVVAGPGGVGKSRLSLELGALLQDNGWDVFRLGSRATGDTVRQLFQRYQNEARISFLIDYAETARSIEDIVEALRAVCQSGGHQARLIANCRISALSSVEDALSNIEFNRIELGGERETEASYLKWVVRKILDHGDIPGRDDVINLCGAMPALASFAVYLFKENRESFEAQFGVLHNAPDFTAWARRRIQAIAAVTGVPSETGLERLSDLALSLPMSREERDSIIDRGEVEGTLLSRLESDLWVEFAGDDLIPAHDVLTDAIAARWLLDTVGQATRRTTDTFRRAASQGRLDKALIVLDRVVFHPNIKELDGREVVRRLLAAQPDAVIEVLPVLLSGRLLDHVQKVEILAEYQELMNAAIEDRSVDSALSAIAFRVASEPEDSPVRKRVFALQPALDCAVAVDHRTNIVLRRAYALFPTRYRDKAIAQIDKYPLESDTHYLIAQILRTESNPALLEDRVKEWLTARSANDIKASFVFCPWLNAAAKLPAEEARERVREVASYIVGDDERAGWLSHFSEREEAQFVYDAWLNTASKLPAEEARERVREVASYIVGDDERAGWLSHFSEREEAQFVYVAWLNAASNLPVEEARERLREVASYIVGDDERSGWLSHFSEREEAEFVYTAWLNAASNLPAEEARARVCEVASYIVGDDERSGWLSHFSEREEAQFIYAAWLNAASKLPAEEARARVCEVASYIVGDDERSGWLSHFSEREEAQFVYTAWLNAASNLPAEEARERVREVASYIVGDDERSGWLSHFSEREEAGFVYYAWLSATGDIGRVRLSVVAWLRRHKTEFDAVYTLKFLVKVRDLDDATVLDALDWCVTYADRLDAICRALPLLANYKNRSVLKMPLIDTSLRVLEHLDGAWLEDYGVLSATLATIGILSFELQQDRERRDRLDEVHCMILTRTRTYEFAATRHVPSFCLNPGLAHHLVGLIDQGDLDAINDGEVIERFLSWLERWPDDRKLKLVKSIERLEAVYPRGDLFERIGVPRRLGSAGDI